MATLTMDQIQQLETQGYLLVKGALDPELDIAGPTKATSPDDPLPKDFGAHAARPGRDEYRKATQRPRFSALSTSADSFSSADAPERRERNRAR